MKDGRRYRLGLTDYRHRARMLTNYENLLRVVVGKKNRYTYSGIYQTLGPNTADVCVYYSDTRHDTGSTAYKDYTLGKRVRDVLRGYPNLRVAIDKGRRKKIIIAEFLRGLQTQDNLDAN